jgi:pimeloyl-ACP methyl ester carboxylesterase
MNPIRRAYIDTADGQIHTRLTAGDGTPIAFLHQTASSGAMWEKVMAALPGRTCYALDTPGFGNSFNPTITPNMADYARWLAQALATIGDQFHLVGHHTGAAIAAQLASDHPQYIASVTFIGPLPLTAEERDGFSKIFGAPFTPRRSGAHLLEI